MNRLEHLIAERDRLELVLASIGDGVITVDTKENIIMMNNGAEKITGYSVDFALNRPLHEVFKIMDKNTGEPQYDLLKLAMDKGEIVGLKKNTVLISKEGNAKYISASISPVKVTDTDIGVVIVFRDITRIRQGEVNLQRYQLLSENANDIIIFSDITGKIIEANHAALIAYGYTKEEILKKSIFALVYPDNRSPVRTQPFKSSAEGVYYEATATRKNGTNFSVEVSLQSAEIGNEKVLLSIQRDISDRKRVQQELEKAREYAEGANLAKSEFLANMSHEIRTPLNGMLGMIDLTLLTDLTEEQRQNLFVAKGCAANLLNLINDILDFSRIEAKKLNLEDISFNFKQLIERSTVLHSIKARQKGLKLEYRIDPQIPLNINGDPNRLEQVINNLLGNAVKFTEDGEIRLLINLKTSTTEYLELEFQVSDTGVGMNQEELKRIFSSFSQADNSITRKYGGTGLGLAISKQLVEMMGWAIWVNSEKGKGSDFFFTIKSSQKLADRKSKPKDPDTIIKVEEPLKILLAEDDKINQLVTARILKEAGHQVETVNNGADAFKVISENRIDLALMDIQMPSMDGLEVVKRVRRMEKGSGNYTPIIALTAYALRGDREKYLAAGMDDYLAKPIQISELLEVIKRNEAKAKTKDKDQSFAENEFYIEPEKLEQGDLMLAYKLNIKKAIEGIDFNLEALNDALRNKNLSLIEKSAREIKKLAQDTNISTIRTAIFKLELAARREDLAAVTEHYNYVSSEFEKIKSQQF